MFTRALKYVGIAAAGSALVGAAMAAVTILAARSATEGGNKARILAEGISEAMNCSAFLFLVGAPIAVIVAYRRQRAR